MNATNTAEQVVTVPEICRKCKRFNEETCKCNKNIEPKYGMFGKISCKREIPKS